MKLTKQDLEVLPMICVGWTNEEIAAHIGLSPDGVKSRVKSLCRRLRARSRAHAVHRAYALGFVRPAPDLPESEAPVVVRVPVDPPSVLAARRAVLLGEEA